MSLTPLQMDQVRAKVSYSEVDLPYNGYMNTLAKVTKLANQILKGKLQEYTSESKFEFNESYVTELEVSADQRFLELQSSLEVKKVAQENWDQSNSETVQRMESKLQDALPALRDLRSDLQTRIVRTQELYDSVSKVNRELEALVEGRTGLTSSKEQWENVLGAALTERLIKQSYLKKIGLQGEEKYRVYDNFTKGPNELKHTNKTIKSDIDRLSEELATYKNKWLKDADIFSRMTSALKEEMSKRDLDLQDTEMEDDEEMEEPEEVEEPEETEEPEELSDDNMLEDDREQSRKSERVDQSDEPSDE